VELVLLSSGQLSEISRVYPEGAKEELQERRGKRKR